MKDEHSYSKKSKEQETRKNRDLTRKNINEKSSKLFFAMNTVPKHLEDLHCLNISDAAPHI